MAQFVAGQALSVLSERVPLRKLADSLLPGRDDDADLLDPKTQLDLFRWRHEHLLPGAARRLKGGIDAKRDPFDVLVDTQDHVLEVARSWVDLVILESFAEAAKGNPLLGKLCTLYALSVIEAERGYFQEHGRLSGARSKAVVKAVNTLCGELRPRRARARGRVRRARERARRRARGRRGAGAGAGVRTRLPRAEREQQTLDQARALFAAHGYAAVTMDQVAAAVGVTKPLLYNYFGNKEQLFLACMKPAADALTEHVVERRVEAPRTRPRRCATASTRSSTFLDGGQGRVADAARRLAAVGRARSPRASHEYRDGMEAMVTAALASRTESRAVEPLSVAIFGAAEALGRWWLRTGAMSAERTADLLIRTIEPGLRTR